MKKFKVPKRKQPFFSIVKKIVSVTLWRGIEVINLAGDIPTKCIFVANHEKKKGPVAYELKLPVFNVKWGAHEMLGNYKSRWKYLRDVYYMKKQGYSKFRASFKATFEAIFSKMIYKGIKVIGTYQDARVRSSIENSIEVLENDMAVTIFAEDSNKGYFEEMTSFFAGFVMLSIQYYRKHDVDLPIFPVYYSHKKRKMIIAKPLYVQDFIKKGYDRYKIADIFKDEVNKLFYTYIKD